MFRILPEGKRFSEHVLLRDGQSVQLRAATPDDVAAVDLLMQSVSRESLQMRFMGAVSHVSRGTIEFLCGGEPRDRLSLLAIAGREGEQRVVAIGNYVSLGVGGRAEVAFLVHEEFQGRGLSTLLLERLAGLAAASGFLGFEAEVLAENQAMIKVFRDSGFEVYQAFEGAGSLHVEFPLAGPASLHERAELRDRIAAANSIRPLLRPRAVAVVGASRSPNAPGGIIFRSILRGDFSGTAYPVNNQAASVHGVRAYSSLAELPERADLAIVAVPVGEVLPVAREALAAGTRGLLVVTSGFAESGPEGARLQDELVGLVRSGGARLIGPNCLGLMNTDPEVRLNASLAAALAPRGRIGFYSHSAALGLVILDYAAQRGLGFSTFVSAGNRADVSGNDLLQYWEEDPATDIALLYLETFGDPRRFARVARRIAFRKPILCVKSARSRAGRAAARAHIGAAAQGDVNVEALFRQTGVIRADTLEEMFDVAALLAHQPLPEGNRVAIIGNSGGVLTICADACEAGGLVVSGPGVVDLGPLVSIEAFERAVQEALERSDVDALIAIYACVGDCDADLAGRGIRRGVLRSERATGRAKPVLMCLMGQSQALQFGAESPADGSARQAFPSYRFPESAARALSRVAQYAAFRRRPAGRQIWYEDASGPAARSQITALLEASAGASVRLSGEAAAVILRPLGITVAGKEGGAGERFTLEIVPDPSFGPLLRVGRTGDEPVVRVTPLTDEDIREVVEEAALPPDSGVEELLGRISQAIEELPWLHALKADVLVSGPPGPARRALLSGDLALELAPAA